MNTEITDKSVKNPVGWIFYDAECLICIRGMWRFSDLFARRGFCWKPLQTPGTAIRLRLSQPVLREDMKVLLADGRVAGGINAWIELFRSVWWLLPLGILLDLPGIHWLGAKSYGWIARNRYCLSKRCNLRTHRNVRHRHASFFEMP